MKYSFFSILIQRYSFYGAGLCFFLSYTIPIFLPPWPTPYHELLHAIALALLVLAFSFVIHQWHLSVSALVLLLIAVIPLVQKFFGIIWFWGDAFLTFLYLCAGAASFILGQNIMQEKQRAWLLQGMCIVLILVGLLNVFFALDHYFKLSIAKDFLLQWPGRPKGNLLQPNNFATCLMMSFLCGWYFFEKTLLSRRFFYLWVGFMCIGLVLAQSRTTILTGVLLIIAYSIFSRWIEFKTRFLDIGFILLCFVGWGYFLPVLSGLFFGEGVDGSLREMQVYDQYRISIWYESLLAIWQNPWGYGWNQIEVATVLVDSPLEDVIFYRHGHNVLLDIIMYNGVIVGGIIILAALFFVQKILRSCCSVEGWFVLAMAGIIITHAMLELPLHYIYFLLPAALFLGLADVGTDRHCSIRYSAYWHVPVITLSVVCIALIWHDYNIIRKENYQLDIELKGAFKREPENEQTHHILIMTQRKAHLEFGRTEVTANMNDQQIEWMRQVSHRFVSPLYLAKYAKACYLNGRQEEVDKILAVIKRLFGEDMQQVSRRYIYQQP